MTTVREILAFAGELWPAADAAGWDASGLAIGDPDAPVTRALFAVDVTAATIADATDSQLLITHHPLLLRPTPYLNSTTNKGALVSALITGGIAQFAAHTNADAADGGTNWALAKLLGLTNTQPLESLVRDSSLGIGRVGTLTQPVTLHELATRLSQVLPATARGITYAGDPQRTIHTVAICTGAGDSLLDHPLVDQADVYISGDLRHHPASDFIEPRQGRRKQGGQRPALIDVAHWASEWAWLPHIAQVFAARFPEVSFRVSTVCTDPWTATVSTKVEAADLVTTLAKL